MSGLAAVGPGGRDFPSSPTAATEQMEGAVSSNLGPQAEIHQESDDDFQYEEVEVPR